jgi:hypothetical protein
MEVHSFIHSPHHDLICELYPFGLHGRLSQLTKSDGMRRPVSGRDAVYAPKISMNDCPMHDQHAAHHAVVESHADQAMGFPHNKTTHHFRMVSDGGAIEVTVDDSGDKANSTAIRSHLSHIAMQERLSRAASKADCPCTLHCGGSKGDGSGCQGQRSDDLGMGSQSKPYDSSIEATC